MTKLEFYCFLTQKKEKGVKLKPNLHWTEKTKKDENRRRMGSAITKTPRRGTSVAKPQVIKQWSKVVLSTIQTTNPKYKIQITNYKYKLQIQIINNDE